MPNTSEASDLKAAITALEAQRAILGDAVVDAALGPMRKQLEELTAAEAPEQQRKQVTVLFADVVGFTAMSETMDAELVASVMNGVWEQLDAAILAHGGRIDKHIGDAVMALWGVDAAREDDPERAIRAALAMQAALAALCRTSAATPLALSMRIGINTGPVLLGQVGSTREFTAMGDTVNLASRLETAAAAGSVLISHATNSQVRGIFDVDALDPLTVKGKAEPVQVYWVKQAKPRAFRLHTRGVEGVETRMIGRDHELGMLQEVFYDAADEGEMRMVTVIGEAGVGKSRLLYEFDNWLELLPYPVTYFKGRATEALQNVPYALFRDLFAFRFAIRDSDSRAVAMEKFRSGFLQSGAIGAIQGEEQALPPSGLTIGQADLVGHWLGFDFSQSEAVGKLLGSADFASVARAHLLTYLRHVTGHDPVVMLLEDLHWADDSSLDLVTHLLNTLPAARFLVVGVSRPSLYERRPLWAEGESVRRIELAPLSRRAGRALVDEILQRVDEVPAALRDTITDTAEGNPFYTEELVKMFIEQGVIVRGAAEAGDRWRVHIDKLSEVKVPPTLTGLLQSRLDGLPQLEQELLQRAAVVGRLFWDGVVADLAQTEQASIKPVLAAVRGRELIFQREHSAFDGSDEFVFKHSLLRDVAYERVLLKWRRDFHGRVARWLEAHAGERLSEYLSLIAEHFQLAGEDDKAAGYLLRAGREAYRANAYAAARRALERMLALREGTAEENRRSVAALVLLGRIYKFQGEFDRASEILARALAGARRIGDEPLEAEALLVRALVSDSRGEFAETEAYSKLALPLAQASGGALLSELMDIMAVNSTRTGDLASAETYGQEALTLARAAGETNLESMALNVLARAAAFSGDLETATKRLKEDLAFARAIGNLARETVALLNLGALGLLTGDYAEVRSYTAAAMKINSGMGDALNQLLLFYNLAQADLHLGDLAAARQSLRSATRMAWDMAAVSEVLQAVLVAGKIMAAEGERERALSWLMLANDHPAFDYEQQQEVKELLEKWQVNEDELAAAKAAAAELDLEEVVAEILAEADA